MEKNDTLHLNKLESPSPKDALCLVVIGPVVLEKKTKIIKVYDNKEEDNDDDGQQTNCDQKSSFEASAQVS